VGGGGGMTNRQDKIYIFFCKKKKKQKKTPQENELVSHSCSGINLQLRSSYVLEYLKKPKLYLKKKKTPRKMKLVGSFGGCGKK